MMQAAYKHENSIRKSLWVASPSLTFTGLIMSVDFAGCFIAMAFDSQQITGVNAWLKPLKFGLSSAITCLTLAWIAGYLTQWPKVRKWASRVFAASISIEIFLIDLQAARGTTSHFNLSTPFDKSIFIVMGVSIGTLWLSMAAMSYALIRQKLSPVSWQWALRLGLLLSLVGAAAGGLMLHQTPEQKAAGNGLYFGAHTAGAPDGGPGLPFLNWSTSHGDLRIPHFLGLHAMQAIPLLAWWLSRRKSLLETQRVQLIWLSTFAYVSVFLLLAWQALRGQALLRPDEVTVIAACVLASVIGTGSALILLPPLRATLSNWARILEVRS
jgi:hypothetical protein